MLLYTGILILQTYILKYFNIYILYKIVHTETLLTLSLLFVCSTDFLDLTVLSIGILLLPPIRISRKAFLSMLLSACSRFLSNGPACDNFVLILICCCLTALNSCTTPLQNITENLLTNTRDSEEKFANVI